MLIVKFSRKGNSQIRFQIAKNYTNSALKKFVKKFADLTKIRQQNSSKRKGKFPNFQDKKKQRRKSSDFFFKTYELQIDERNYERLPFLKKGDPLFPSFRFGDFLSFLFLYCLYSFFIVFTHLRIFYIIINFNSLCYREQRAKQFCQILLLVIRKTILSKILKYSLLLELSHYSNPLITRTLWISLITRNNRHHSIHLSQRDASLIETILNTS